jgi:arsenate reductase (thioredoxin)
MRGQVLYLLLALITIGWPGCLESQNKRPESNSRSEVVFVCEHGAALSVVSAAYFNKIAREEHLPLHAIARGTNPQEEIAVSARQGLEHDGVTFAPRRPKALSAEDASHAKRIIAFCPLPSKYSRLAPIENWSDVPSTSSNYELARDAILRHLHDLIQRLKTTDQKR